MSPVWVAFWVGMVIGFFVGFNCWILWMEWRDR